MKGQSAMYEEKKDKVMRVLSIYKRLMEGDIINKEAEDNYYNVTTRSIQRDIDDIRSFMDMENSKTGVLNSVIYDRTNKGYQLEQVYNMKLSNGEITSCRAVRGGCRPLRQSQKSGKLVYGGGSPPDKGQGP